MPLAQLADQNPWQEALSFDDSCDGSPLSQMEIDETSSQRQSTNECCIQSRAHQFFAEEVRLVFGSFPHCELDFGRIHRICCQQSEFPLELNSRGPQPFI
ncbi:unnamed protein product [Cyprideis torosa]|uniref:Uncharacterized protein n=1 Tax=Cyprideis torosa TaxID=163714 RepID=A0A7R8W6V6_9CRUS|nr:unnamed protein product [Cyprideis torosa]CAG0886889.1 unnamed protein product [Cyprideis torosa]